MFIPLKKSQIFIVWFNKLIRVHFTYNLKCKNYIYMLYNKQCYFFLLILNVLIITLGKFCQIKISINSGQYSSKFPKISHKFTFNNLSIDFWWKHLYIIRFCPPSNLTIKVWFGFYSWLQTAIASTIALCYFLNYIWN